jgi:hypothetical protein
MIYYVFGGGVIGIALDLLILAGVVYLATRWPVPAAFAVGFIGAIACSIAGLLFLNDVKATNDTAGAVLLVGGLALFLGCAGLAWIYSAWKRPGVFGAVAIDVGEQDDS